MRREYRRKTDQIVVAVQLNLDTDGFRFRKWGAEQWCKAGDWIVNSQGDTHTVERETFARTYHQVQPGQYRKVTNIWAEPASEAGSVQTLEGTTHHAAGDYVIFDEEHGPATYAVTASRFVDLYEPVS